jgi:hypothetical protein
LLIDGIKIEKALYKKEIRIAEQEQQVYTPKIGSDAGCHWKEDLRIWRKISNNSADDRVFLAE